MSFASQDGSPSNKLIVYQRKVHAKTKEKDSLEIEPPKSRYDPNETGPSCMYQTLDCRSFWKAGSDDAFPAPSYTVNEKLEASEFERARVHPKFLHSNATSHTWAFGAVAELLDNAVDEICNGASFVKVDRIFNPKDGSPVLVFHDDGGGMDPEGIRRCMSLGFSSKRSSQTIGQYGNGFKTSTMRLGADVIVFTCSDCGSCCTQSIGLLSYTYLMKTMKSDIIVPIVDFKIAEDQTVPLIYASVENWNNDLKIITDWSPFTTKDELMKQFEDIDSHGTRILVYNLWFDDDGVLELEFDDVKNDIKLQDNAKHASSSHRVEIIQSHISYAYRYSLRAYISILYLKEYTNFRIILMGKPVEHLNLANEMKFLKVVPYRPFIGKEESVETTVGFTKEAPILGTFGFNIYHKNRLIKAFCKPLQEAGVRGKCVIGFLEANFLEPAHDKQDFERSPLYHRLETKLKQMTIDYWRTHCHMIGYQSPSTAIRAKQKQTNQASLVPNPNAMSIQPVSSQPAVGSLATLQRPFLVEEPMVCTTTNMPTELPQDGLGAVNGSAASVFGAGLVPSAMLEEGLSLEESETIPPVDSAIIDKISKENVKLSIRRDEYMSRQEELKKQIVMLEEELDETRKNCARLAMEIEIQKKQKVAGN